MSPFSIECPLSPSAVDSTFARAVIEPEQVAEDRPLLLHEIEQHPLVLRPQIPHPDAEQTRCQGQVRMPLHDRLPHIRPGIECFRGRLGVSLLRETAYE